MVVGGGGGGGWWFPSYYLVSTHLQLRLFCCWGSGSCWAVKIFEIFGGQTSFQASNKNYLKYSNKKTLLRTTL